jgi:hypothetical protein
MHIHPRSLLIRLAPLSLILHLYCLMSHTRTVFASPATILIDVMFDKDLVY